MLLNKSGRRRGWTAILGLVLTVSVATAAEPVADAPRHPALRVAQAEPNPPPLRRPLDGPQPEAEAAPPTLFEPFLRADVDPPLGFTGRSSVLPREAQDSDDFVPVEDRWRIGFPSWDRYGKGHPLTDDYPYQEGRWYDPFNQNVLKGDYPILGQNTFFVLTATSFSDFEARQVPTPTTPFESTVRPFEAEFFGKPGQFQYQQFFRVSLDLFHGDAAFKPVDWRIKVTPVFNVNTLNVNELAIVNPDVQDGTGRGRTFFALEEWFVEAKLADLSPDYDFVSARAGSQFFNADFRGFLFVDTNRAVRLFGTRNANRDQFNLIYFDQMEKDTNSTLNNIARDRNQNVLIGNYYHQDFIWPGYTAQVSATYNRDQPSFHFNRNNFLVRPDPVGTFTPHNLDICYLGWAGDGHINRFNITHQYYLALGRDSLNPLANRGQDVVAHFAALELSYDRDWARFRTSFLYASGDGNINNGIATGFDSIFDNPNFAGGDFTYFQRQAIALFGVNLTNAGSTLPDLRSSKIQGQSNFVNPGLFLANFGLDMDLTPKWKIINNLNFLWFDKTNVLEQFVFQNRIQRFIGADLSTGIEYRPLLSNNIVATMGLSLLVPGDGFRDLYNNRVDRVDPLFAGFMTLTLTY